MNTELAYNEFILNRISVERDALLSNHSTFKIGGECSLAVFPKDKDELLFAIRTLSTHGIRHKVVGRGSNILFSDNGYAGALIFTSKMCGVRSLGDGEIYADGGTTLKSIANFAYKKSLSGFEFAHGIPGSCGGAVYMNAGAYGGEISNVLKYTDYYDTKTGECGRMENAEHAFAYRHSIFSDKKELIILGACFELSVGDPAEIKRVMDENSEKKKTKATA